MYFLNILLTFSIWEKLINLYQLAQVTSAQLQILHLKEFPHIKNNSPTKILLLTNKKVKQKPQNKTKTP